MAGGRGRRGPAVEQYKAAEATLAAYKEEAQELVYLQTGMLMARVVEVAGAEAFRDSRYGARDQFVEGSLIGGAFAAPSANLPVTLATVAANGLGRAGEAIAVRLAASEEEFAALPDMLREEPEKAVALMSKVATAEQWGRIASYVLTAGFSAARLAVAGRENTLRTLAEDGAAVLLNESTK